MVLPPPFNTKTALSADNAVLLVSDKNLIGVTHIFKIGNNRFRRRLRFFTDTCTLQGQLLYTGVDNLIGRSADALWSAKFRPETWHWPH